MKLLRRFRMNSKEMNPQITQIWPIDVGILRNLRNLRIILFAGFRAVCVSERLRGGRLHTIYFDSRCVFVR